MMRTSGKLPRVRNSTMWNNDTAITTTWQMWRWRFWGLVFRLAERLSERRGMGSLDRFAIACTVGVNQCVSSLPRYLREMCALLRRVATG
jgi:hypothetical protein